MEGRAGESPSLSRERRTRAGQTEPGPPPSTATRGAGDRQWEAGRPRGWGHTHRSLLSWAKRLLTSSTVTSKNSSGSSAGQAWSSSPRSGWHTTGSRSTSCQAEHTADAGSRGPAMWTGSPRPCNWSSYPPHVRPWPPTSLWPGEASGWGVGLSLASRLGLCQGPGGG